MYCIKCGAELADSEKACPLCKTVVFHPDISRTQSEPPFPPYRDIAEEVNPAGVLFVLTMLFALPFVITLLCDWRINDAITWSGYACGAILLIYIIVVLPLWFKSPNPVIFVPVDFAAVGLYLLYIDLATRGGWFLGFALPVTGAAMLIASAVVALLRYLRKGWLYVFGGALIATGGYAVLVEYLLNTSFGLHQTFFWSFYPLAACFLLGMMLIIIAASPTMRESLRRKFFI